MNQFQGLELFASLLLLFTPLSAAGAGAGPGVLDSTVRDCAFKELHHRRSGVPYEVPLPASLSGVTSSAARMGSRALWSSGADLAAFRIPPRAVPVPFVRRLALVYENLGGSWQRSSAHYYGVDYSLVAPVVGLLAYNASDAAAAAEVDLNVTGDPILIRFQGLVEYSAPPEEAGTARTGSTLLQYYCARLARDGSVQVVGAVAPNWTCSTRSTGHFAVVVPRGPRADGGGGGSRWWWWRRAASGCGGGAVGLGLLGLVGMRIFRLFRERKVVRGMEARAEEGEALDCVWVGKSKMPSAAAMRTKPVLETSTTP